MFARVYFSAVILHATKKSSSTLGQWNQQDFAWTYMTAQTGEEAGCG